jgi:hypothetical protein
LNKERPYTMLPFVTAPPNKISMESETPVESRMKTAFTFTFSQNTSHGYGMVWYFAFTEF